MTLLLAISWNRPPVSVSHAAAVSSFQSLECVRVCVCVCVRARVCVRTRARRCAYIYNFNLCTQNTLGECVKEFVNA